MISARSSEAWHKDRRDAHLRAFLGPLDVRKLNGFGSAITAKLQASIAERRKMTARPGAGERSDQREGSQRWWDDAPGYEILTVDLARRLFTASHFDELFGARLGARLWDLLNGRDEEPVTPAAEWPAQISIEDTYRGIRGDEVIRQLEILGYSLMRRLETELVEEDGDGAARARDRVLNPRVVRKDESWHEQGVCGTIRTYDLAEDDSDEEDNADKRQRRHRRWLQHPLGLRLSIRIRWNARTSKQVKMPVGIFDLSISRRRRSKLIAQACATMLRSLLTGAGPNGGGEHPERGDDQGLNLLNIAAINLVKDRPARSIDAMFSSAAAYDRSRAVNHRSQDVDRTQSDAQAQMSRQEMIRRQGFDEATFNELPEELQAELLFSDAGEVHIPPTSAVAAAAVSMALHQPKEEVLVECAVCQRDMLLFMQHDHDTWPETGLPPLTDAAWCENDEESEVDDYMDVA